MYMQYVYKYTLYINVIQYVMTPTLPSPPPFVLIFTSIEYISTPNNTAMYKVNTLWRRVL